MAQASREIVVTNQQGFHARPAMVLADLAKQFTSHVMIYKDGEPPEQSEKADAKSVLELVTLAAIKGTKLRIVADGDDAEQAVTQLTRLFETKFGEE